MNNIYKILDGEGETVNTIVADEAFMSANYLPAQYELLGPVDEPPATAAPIRIDTPLFIMRFTPQERIAMRDYAAAGEDYSKHVNDWLMILNDPRLAYVELGDLNLIVAMGMMVSLGLLTQERADIVMAP